MEPQWHQDIHSKGIQPKHLPQYEAVGNQLDWEHRKKATQMVVSATGIATAIIFIFIIIVVIPKAVKFQKTTFAQIKSNEGSQEFQDKITLQVYQIKREETLPGKIFTTRANPGFIFIIMEVSITNQAQDDYMLNPFSFGLFTKDGKQFRTDLATHKYPEKLPQKKLKPGTNARGMILFKVPKNVQPDSLELIGANGPLAKFQI